MNIKNLSLCFFIFIVTSCSSNKYAVTNRDYKKQVKSLAKEIKKYPLEGTRKTRISAVNFGLRKPDFVIIHHTAQNSCEQTLQTFTLKRTQVSAHYLICKDGSVHHLLNDYLRAWHAGISSWGNNKDINSCSIGIELDNNGYEPFTSAQINNLLILLDTLKRKYHIPAANFIGHADVAPARKNDPNVNFPWQLLSQHGYGLWYGDTSLVTLPANFNDMQALRIVGYSIKDSTAAIIAFNRHFNQKDSCASLDARDKKILYTLMMQYQ